MTRAEGLQIVTAAGVAALFALSLPIRVNDAAARSSSDECVTLSQRPPGHEAAGAIPRYLRCLELEPRDVVLLRDVGLLYEESGDVARAEKMYQRALGIDPAYADVHARMGWLLLRKGDKGAARASADRAAALTLNASAVAALREAAQ
jgi:tetratricopeptide (TPR) repeat protein